LAAQNFIRIAAVALCLSTLSFAAGVAGDLSIIDPPRSGQRVVLRIPPEIPSDAPRAAPLLSTASAEAAQLIAPRRHAARNRLMEIVELAHEPEHATDIALLTPVVLQEKPRYDPLRVGQKPRSELASKPDETKPA
jgi:hypothetical protein